MTRPGDNLPRPATPGPWRVESAYSKDCRTGEPMWFVPAVETLGDHECGGMTRREAELVAALPEWIAAHDAEREGRLRAEAQVRALEEALGEALEASREPRAERALAEVRDYVEFRFRHGTDRTAGVLHRMLRDRGFGGGS